MFGLLRTMNLCTDNKEMDLPLKLDLPLDGSTFKTFLPLQIKTMFSTMY